MKYISDDAPHLGANVPVAYQALVQYIAPWKIISVGGSFPSITIQWKDMFPDAVNGLNLFNSPAAKQMLLQRYVLNGETLTAANSMHNNFMNEINNMGWPVNCRNIVLSNGACNGTLTFPDNDRQLLDITGSHGTGWTYFGAMWRSLAMTIGGIPGVSGVVAPNVPVQNLSLLFQFPLSIISTKQSVNFDFGAWAVPSSGTALIFKGDVFMRRKLLWTINVNSYILKCHVNSSANMLPADNAPGGKYDLNLFGINTDQINEELHEKLGDWINLNVHQNQFCFVPTVSALALTNQWVNLKSSVCNNIACLLPAGVKNYYAPQQNEIHVSYTTNNSNWILQQQDAGVNCLAVCSSGLSMSGSDVICPDGTFSISNVPAGATVSWSASPAGLVTIPSGNSNPITITRSGSSNGTVTIYGTVNGCSTATLSKNAIVGKPATPGITINGIEPLQYGTQMDVTVTTSAAAPYLWYVNGSLVYTAYVKSATINGGNNCNVTNTLMVSVSNTCGASTNSTAYVRPCTASGLLYTLYPNPATNAITISSVSNKIAGSGFSEVQIVDKLKNIRKQFKYPNNVSTATIDVSNLQTDVYVVRIFDGKNWINQQLIIKGK